MQVVHPPRGVDLGARRVLIDVEDCDVATALRDGDVFPASPYYATKGAVINLTRDLAVEWAPFKINVNAIAPGFFPSEMTEGIFQDPHYLEYINKQTPLGRTGTPDDLKGAIVFLASQASDYVTGQTIFVDGGWTSW